MANQKEWLEKNNQAASRTLVRLGLSVFPDGYGRNVRLIS
jgi:hypothetical protein